MYSFSTCWNSHRHTDGRAMLREIRELGVEFAELSHGIRISLLPGIFEAVDAGEIKISSLHNFCPLPIGTDRPAPNLYKFSADDRRERDSAFKHTVKTLDTAVRVGARLVVLHSGSVDMKDYTDKLLDMLGEGQQNTPRYEKLCAEAREKREAKKAKYYENTLEMVRRIVDEAKPRGLKLGIENREALEEIPFESDFDFFLKELRDPTVVYWHDTGHAQIKENLGFINHREFLQSRADRLYGFHVHDVEFPGRDHRPPGAGTIDFAGLKPLVQPAHLKVLELSPSVTSDEARQGMQQIKSLWGAE
jgi:sugar phosphate isomerase/epimerase